MKKTLLTTSIFALFVGSAMAVDFPINEVNKTVSEGTATQQIISDSSLNISTESNITSNTVTTEKDVTDISGGFAVLSESSNINGLNLTNNSILANKDGTYYVQQNNKYYTNQNINGGIFLISGTENITTLNNSKFDNNSITSRSVGGNIDGALIKTDQAELNSENLTLTNNKVIKRVAYTNNSTISTVSLNGNSTFKNLIATSNLVEVEKPSGGNSNFDNIFGGILSVNSGRTVVSESNLSSNNIIASDSGKINGGIIANSSTLELSNSDLNKNTITANSSPSLLGGIVFNQGNATISNSHFNENIITTKSSFNGGIIASTAGTLQIDNSNFEANLLTIDATVGQVGGGIVSVESSTAKINGGKFANNTVNAGYGIDGSVANVEKGASLEISDAEISGNVASAGTYKVRGTVHNYNGKLSISGTTFSDNTIDASTENRALGGALYARWSDARASTTVTDVSFKNNVAKNGMGGAIALEGGSMTINATADLSASGNYATDKNGIASDARGGFLYLENYDGLYAATATFNVAENATYTMGNGTANQDSIA